MERIDTFSSQFITEIRLFGCFGGIKRNSDELFDGISVFRGENAPYTISFFIR